MSSLWDLFLRFLDSGYLTVLTLPPELCILGFRVEAGGSSPSSLLLLV